ncbi:hypothetical protein MTR_0443s0060 [Medicago truncatula]|uniref:Uncharacterized protein n=1 Tax=Medicago truncatula TaxID=3880 RepID=A0A072TG31_MEDTR|nr:hypothetical protein MTR_0443s0060 [Medicago truncatula]
MGFWGKTSFLPVQKFIARLASIHASYTQVGPLDMHKNSGEGFGPGVLVAQQR